MEPENNFPPFILMNFISYAVYQTALQFVHFSINFLHLIASNFKITSTQGDFSHNSLGEA